MIHSATRLLALVAPLLLAAATVGVAPTYGEAAARADGAATSERIVVKWNGTQKNPKYEKRLAIPGIGTLAAVCRPNDIMVRITPYDRSAETQMWLAKYEDKSFDDRADSVVVKNVRVYRYANADDDGEGGTGASAHEGLNIRGDIENRNAGGYAYGVISQRPGRHRPAGATTPPPATGFKLTWGWNGFDYEQAWRSCKISIRTETYPGASVALNWHGDEDADGHTTTSTTVPRIGDVMLTCATGDPNVRDLGIRPDGNGTGSPVYVEEITGEGAIGQHVETYSQPADPVAGSIAGIELPRNGMLRIRYRGQWLMVSSYLVTNNRKPWLNVCEIAAAPVPG